MIQTFSLAPGVTLRCCPESRFKHACLSVQFVTPMAQDTAAMNALLPAVLLRGCQSAPDLRSITARLDDLYGASVSTLVRRVGDYHTTGVYCSFLEDRFALEGDSVLQPMVRFLLELLLESVTEEGAFRSDFVAGEKKNLISTIESELNDKRAYAAARMLKLLCAGDSFQLPRLGTVESVQAITPQGLYDHYRKLLSGAAIELFYVGSAPAEEVSQLLQPLFAHRTAVPPLPPQTAFVPQADPGEHRETMDVTQGKLCMGFTTPITNQSPEFIPMQVLCCLYGGSTPVNKLFMTVREKLSLCYDIAAGYFGTKGILTVSAGVETCNLEQTRDEILRQLTLCQGGQITPEELRSAKQALLSGLRTVTDSPGALEGYYSTGHLSGFLLPPEQYRAAIEQVTMERVVAAAQTIRLHTVYFLEGVQA